MNKSLLLMLVSTALLAACNTLSGVGKDIKAGGQAVENIAQ